MAATVPMNPPKPSARSALAGTRNRLPNPNKVVVIDQKEGEDVVRHASRVRSPFVFPVRRAMFRQLDVKYARWDKVITKTMVLRLTVRTPIFVPSKAWTSRVIM